MIEHGPWLWGEGQGAEVGKGDKKKIDVRDPDASRLPYDVLQDT